MSAVETVDYSLSCPYHPPAPCILTFVTCKYVLAQYSSAQNENCHFVKTYGTHRDYDEFKARPSALESLNLSIYVP